MWIRIIDSYAEKWSLSLNIDRIELEGIESLLCNVVIADGVLEAEVELVLPVDEGEAGVGVGLVADM